MRKSVTDEDNFAATSDSSLMRAAGVPAIRHSFAAFAQ